MAPAPLPPFQIEPTEDPNERAFLATIGQDRFLDGSTNFPVAGVTTYAEIVNAQAERAMGEFGSYVYTKQAKAPLGYVAFYFGKPKTDAQKLIPFRTTPVESGPHGWPPILKALAFLEDSSAPRTANVIDALGNPGIAQGNAYYPREVYVPPASEGSKFILEEYQAPTPFDIPQNIAPILGSVSYDIPGGKSGHFPACLHENVKIPNTVGASNATFIVGQNAFSGNIDGQLFPETNFTEWTPYYVSQKQVQLESGIWYMTRLQVIPPPEPDTITQ